VILSTSESYSPSDETETSDSIVLPMTAESRMRRLGMRVSESEGEMGEVREDIAG
jgi:hypothetical protein